METAKVPNLRVGIGAQGLGVGNPGFFATSEKHFKAGDGMANVFIGFGHRSNEHHGHMLSGLKYSPDKTLTFGVQLDGHNRNGFASARFGDFAVGGYLIDFKRPGFMISWSTK